MIDIRYRLKPKAQCISGQVAAEALNPLLDLFCRAVASMVNVLLRSMRSFQ